MTIVATLQEIFEEFDKQPFIPVLENIVFNKIHSSVSELKKDFSSKEMADLIAFRFLERHNKGNNEWDTFYQPLSSATKEDGTKATFPSLESITPEILNYWKHRASETKHPVLLARYTGLLHDFYPIILGKKVNYQISIQHVSALLNVIREQLYVVPTYAIGKVSRALEVALSLNDKRLINDVKKNILQLEKEIAVNTQPGLWGFSFDLLLNGKNKIATTEEEIDIIQTLEQRLADTISIDSWATECAVRLLSNYYRRKQLYAEVERVINCLEKSFELTENNSPSFQKTGYLETLHQLYTEFGFTEKAESILIRLRELNKDSDSYLKTISSEGGISKARLDDYVNRVLKGDCKAILTRIAVAHTPNIQKEDEDLEKSCRANPFAYLCSTTLIDEQGRKTAILAPINVEREGHLIAHISKTLRVDTILLHSLFEEGLRREIFNPHEIIKFLSQSCLIRKERLFIIERAVKAYFEKDYLTAIHLFLPQFEEAIRNLVEMNGGAILVYNKDGSFNLKILNHLLDDDIVKSTFGKDMHFYFKVLMDKRGWNMRNKVAHGMAEANVFCKQDADRLVHAYLCLGLVQLKN
jgi:hypothetical protein